MIEYICSKCNGLMTPTKVYTEGCPTIDAMKCMNCGKYEYAPLELRVIPVEDYKKHERISRGGNRTLRKIVCEYCGNEGEGYGYKYCSRKCQNAVTNRNTKLQRAKAKEMT